MSLTPIAYLTTWSSTRANLSTNVAHIATAEFDRDTAATDVDVTPVFIIGPLACV